MNVLYTCDDNYVWIMGISMISLLENNSNIQELKIFLLSDNISSKNKKMLSEIARKYNRTFTVIDIPKLHIPDVLYSQRWPKSAYTRLYSGNILPKSVHKILYLDCDTVIKDDISQLWKIDVSNAAVSGVKDCIGKNYLKNIGLEKNSAYINAGVLLINLDILRNINISEAVFEFLNKYKKLLSYADQDILNGIFNGNIGVLEPQYNVMTLLYAHKYEEIVKLRKPVNYYLKNEIEYATSNPAIIHFTTCMLNIRPWFKNSNHPYAYLFDRYKAISPWNLRENVEVDFNNKKEKIIRLVFKLPNAIDILGFLHATLKPYAFWLKSKI